MTDSPRKAESRIQAAGWILAFVAANWYFLSWSSFQKFNFFDFGPFLDAAWRVSIGQVPYRDFIYITGPGHLYMLAFFFSLVGFGKTAILLHMVVLGSIAAAAVFFVARKSHNRWLAPFLGCFAVTSFYWPMSHPWYDHSAYFWVILAIAAAILPFPYRDGRAAFFSSVAAGIFIFLSHLTKANIGAFFWMALTLFFLAEKNRRRTLIGFLVGTVIVAFTFALLFPLEDFFFQTISVYSGQASRFQILLKPAHWLSNGYYVVFLIVLGSSFSQRRFSPTHLLALGLVIAALAATLTSSIVGDGLHFPTMAVITAVAFLAIGVATPGESPAFRRILSSLLALFVAALMIGSVGLSVTREWGVPSELFPSGDYELQNEKMRGWRCARNDGEALDQLVQFFEVRDGSLLVLTHLQILYPAAQRESYKEIPFIWTVPYMPAKGPQLETVRRRILENPPDWIVLDKKPRYQSRYIITDSKSLIEHLGLPNRFFDDYTMELELADYAVLRRRNLATTSSH